MADLPPVPDPFGTGRVMHRVAEIAAPIAGVIIATATLIAAASPRWLPAVEAPASMECAMGLAHAMSTSLDWLIRWAAWLTGIALQSPATA